VLESRLMAWWRLLLIVLFAGVASAQSGAPVEITAEPHHHLVLQNAYIRVFQVDIPSGEATLLHRHGHDFISVNLGKARISNQAEGKPPATANLADGQTVFVARGVTHVVRNLGTAPFRNLDVELLQDGKPGRAQTPRWEEDRGLNILEGGSQDILFVKNGVRVSEVDLQPGGMFPQNQHHGPQLVIAVTDLHLHRGMPGKRAAQIQLTPGNCQWVQSGNRTVVNMGKQPAKLILLEFH
jgi:quercetin dioxygenase-like cupin family protein